ncbi:glycoside hydrolase family 99-like domain-containing protein [Polaribacter sp.]|jgi:hypothetical protein|uniref:glycoside hydrolase family 99-like domain-containing protein n=1 Tax=Polaribacter sp. TaxID=1920175 RepID=UPI0040472E09
MKTINKFIILITLLAGYSCTEDNITEAGNTILDYDIPQVPVTSNYLVGSIYHRFGRLDRVVEAPSIGIYNGNLGDPIVYEEHVKQAQTAGIDFFVFEMRSSYNIAQYDQDVSFMDGLLTAPNANDINFAIRYNFGSMSLNNNNRIERKNLVAKFIDDFTKMTPYFQKSNYMSVDNKKVVYITNAFNLFSDDNSALYQQMRTELRNLGFELFIIGEQLEWTPTLRFDFRFVNAVDAVTHKTYALINVNEYDRFNTFHKFTDIAFNIHKDIWSNHNIEYIPTISPSINVRLQNPGSPTFIIEKKSQWFRDFCNIARRTTGTNRIVILDSFNNWNNDTQVETAESYGEDYLKIVREEFKAN